MSYWAPNSNNAYISKKTWSVVADFTDAFTRVSMVAFGPYFIENYLDVKESQVVIWWSFSVTAYMIGRALASTTGLCFSFATNYNNRGIISSITPYILLFSITYCFWFLGAVNKYRDFVVIRFLMGFFTRLISMKSCDENNIDNNNDSNTNTSDNGNNNNRQQQPTIISKTWLLGCVTAGIFGGVIFGGKLEKYVHRKDLYYKKAIKFLMKFSTIGAFCVIFFIFIYYFFVWKRHQTQDEYKFQCGDNRRRFDSINDTSFDNEEQGISLIPKRRNMYSSDTITTNDEPPVTYLKACKGNRKRAIDMYAITLAWRQSNNIDQILSEPQQYYDNIKKYYPHYLHGRSLHNEMVSYEFPGQMDLKKLTSLGISAKDIGRHMAFINEFAYKKLEPTDEARMMTVLDIGGFTLSNLSSEVLEVIKISGEILNNHYPERITRIIVVNVPFFVGSAWSVIANVLPKATREKLTISNNALRDLQKFIPISNIPKKYGGASDKELGFSDEEVLLKRLVDETTSSLSSSLSNSNNDNYNNSIGIQQQPSGITSTTRQPISNNKNKSNTINKHENNNDSSTGGLVSKLNPIKWFSSTVKKAHLGQKNVFYYDQQKQMWIFDENNITNKNSNSSDNTVEEKGLVLAIQAAHYKHRSLRDEFVNGDYPSYNQGGARRHDSYSENKNLNIDHGSSSHLHYRSASRDRDLGGSQDTYRPSSFLIIQMTFLYTVWCFMQLSIESILPVWVGTQTKYGGLELTPIEIGIGIAIISLLSMTFECFALSWLLQIPMRSPLRAFRFGSGLLLFTIFNLYFLPYIGTNSLSIFALRCFTILNLSILCISLVVARTASALLLYLVLKDVCTSPYIIVKLVGFFGETIGPPLSSLLFAWAMRAEMPYPMDSRFFFNLCGISSLGLYMISLILHVNVVGDFGISSENNSYNSRWGMLEDIFEIPVNDFNYMLGDTSGSRTNPNYRNTKIS